MRISDWSSDVCSSDLPAARRRLRRCDCAGCEGAGIAETPTAGCAAPTARKETGHKGVIPGDAMLDRQSVVWGKSVSVRVDLGGRRIINKKKNINTNAYDIDSDASTIRK